MKASFNIPGVYFTPEPEWVEILEDCTIEHRTTVMGGGWALYETIFRSHNPYFDRSCGDEDSVQ